jgi:hypothetical protein
MKPCRTALPAWTDEFRGLRGAAPQHARILGFPSGCLFPRGRAAATAARRRALPGRGLVPPGNSLVTPPRSGAIRPKQGTHALCTPMIPPPHAQEPHEVVEGEMARSSRAAPGCLLVAVNTFLLAATAGAAGGHHGE